MKQINNYALLAIFVLGIARCTSAHAVENTKAYTFPSSERPVEFREKTFSDSFFWVLGGLVTVKTAQFIYENWQSIPSACAKVRTGQYISQIKIDTTWKALKQLADERPYDYRLILLCLAQQCDQALKANTTCTIRLYGSFKIWQDHTELFNKLRSLGIIDENNSIDHDNCHIILSSFSGTLYPLVKGGGVRIPIYLPLQSMPELIHPQASFLSKLPGYDRRNAYKPHSKQ